MTNLEFKKWHREEGAEEFELGGGITNNPHPQGSERWLQWRLGWKCACLNSGRPSGPLPTWRHAL